MAFLAACAASECLGIDLALSGRSGGFSAPPDPHAPPPPSVGGDVSWPGTCPKYSPGGYGGLCRGKARGELGALTELKRESSAAAPSRPPGDSGEPGACSACTRAFTGDWCGWRACSATGGSGFRVSGLGFGVEGLWLRA